MLKLVNDFKIEDLKKYGFTSFKANRNLTNYYRIFAHAHKGTGNMLLITNTLREVLILNYEGDNDTRVHARPRIRVKDKTWVEDVICQLAKDGVIEIGQKI